MLCQLGGVLVEPLRVLHLQRPRDLLMQADAARRDEFLVERLPEEGVLEAVAHPAQLRALLDNRRTNRLAQCLDHLLLVHPRHDQQRPACRVAART